LLEFRRRENCTEHVPLLGVARGQPCLQGGTPHSRVGTHYASVFRGNQASRKSLDLSQETSRLVNAALRSMAIPIAVRSNDRLVVTKLAQVFLGEPAMNDDARVAIALRQDFAVGR